MSPDDLIALYRMGYFPMAQARDDTGFDIVAPHMRGLLPIHTLHVARRLRRTIRARAFEIRIDTAFAAVIRACAEARDDTWINADIEALYTELYRRGSAHSVECWRDGVLVGGLYGVAVGGTFCGESMFAHVTDASKVALVALCARLSGLGYRLLDAQFRNPHLDQFGLYEIPQEEYVAALQAHMGYDLGMGAVGFMPVFEIENYLDLRVG